VSRRIKLIKCIGESIVDEDGYNNLFYKIVNDNSVEWITVTDEQYKIINSTAGHNYFYYGDNYKFSNSKVRYIIIEDVDYAVKNKVEQELSIEEHIANIRKSYQKEQNKIKKREEQKAKQEKKRKEYAAQKKNRQLENAKKLLIKEGIISE
jgi:hypothetical protein